MKASKFFQGAALIGLMLSPLAAIAQSAAPFPQVSVTGEGQVEVAPDMATLTVGVTSRGASAAESLAANSADQSKVLAALVEAGLEPRDVQTSSVNLNPVWASIDSGATEIVGYEASNQVTLRIRDLTKLGTVMDSVVSVGVNQIYGLNFGLIDQEPQIDSARLAAVADARRKAELLAEAAGMQLGAVISISEGGRQYGGPAVAFARDSGAGVPVVEGSVNVGLTVSMTWSLVAPTEPK